MDSLDRLIERPEPIPSAATGEEACARFQAAPDTALLALVDAENRPIALLDRGALLLRLADDPSTREAPVRDLAPSDPLILEADTPLLQACRAVLARRDSAAAGGFIVVREGRYLGLGVALSLLAAADAEAESATRAGARFLDMVSRDLRAPLNGVVAMAELLERQPLPADARTCVGAVLERGATLSRLLRDAVELSRAETCSFALAPEPTTLRDLMDEVQVAWLPRAVENGLGLSVNYAGEPTLAAELDAGRLKQVFGALLAHGLGVTRRGGVEAGLSAAPVDGVVRLSAFVRDSGPGLRFAEADDASGSLDRPATLELAICRRILEGMGGRIWTENNTGAGSTVRFELDAPAPKATPAETAAEKAGARPVLRGHVLIVDDNATNRMVAQTLIEMFGCTVVTAEDGVEAVAAVGRTHFDAILMDIRMPRMNGVEATRAIRSLPGPERGTPIIALTANADPDDARRYLASGMAGVVEKPIKADRLLGAMIDVLGDAPAVAQTATA
jgi:CheY-like chemotaxis protein/signal transduction histidine kinase